MPICIFGEPTDLMPAYVAWLAGKRKIEVLWLSESTLGTEWSFRFNSRSAKGSFAPPSDSPSTLTVDMHKTHARRLSFAQLRGAYVNLNPQPALPLELDLEPQEKSLFLHTRRNNLYTLLDNLPCTVANRACAGRSNNSKPHQMRLLSHAGFQIPEWIASSDPEAVAQFSTQMNGDVIAKSCSGLRSHVKKVDDELLAGLAAGSTPIIVQRYIQGKDVRVHTVAGQTGEGQAFATEIVSDHVDYRFDNGPKTYRACTIPPEIEAACHRFAAHEQMVIAGFDFKVAADGRWYCLEMNPVPTFLPYEMQTGQRIGDALLDAMGPDTIGPNTIGPDAVGLTAPEQSAPQFIYPETHLSTQRTP